MELIRIKTRLRVAVRWMGSASHFTPCTSAPMLVDGLALHVFVRARDRVTSDGRRAAAVGTSHVTYYYIKSISASSPRAASPRAVAAPAPTLAPTLAPTPTLAPALEERNFTASPARASPP